MTSEMPADTSASGQAGRDQPEISVVIAMFNEEEVIPALFARLLPVMQANARSFEVVCVDDGSADGTARVLLDWQRRDSRIRLVTLSRNFGKEVAMTAGLDAARGQAIVIIDADLQDPPELIATFIDYWRKGFENVYGVRVDRSRDQLAKRFTAQSFYRVFNALSEISIPENAGDFRLLGSQAVAALRLCRERRRFMKGLYAWIGFASVAVPYERAVREAGRTKFNYWKLWNFALEGISSHSSAPLRVFSYLGAMCIAGSLLLVLWLLLDYVLWHHNAQGFYLTLISILLLFSINLIGLGLIGEYVGRIYEETKQRPLYLTRDPAMPAEVDARRENA